jgi:dTDP-4-dehydrorhamnose 3,5-epimerase
MKFHKQSIDGVFLIETEPCRDERGSFHRNFCRREYEAYGLESNICQTNISLNAHQYTLRGFHYQRQPFQEGKTITCEHGSIYVILVDLRRKSSTFLKWESYNLPAVEGINIFVPPGCANAFLTLEENTLIHYYMSEFYNPNSYVGFRYNDPFFNFKWPSDPVVISEKDLSFPDFDKEKI